MKYTFTKEQIAEQIKANGSIKSIGGEVIIVALSKPRGLFGYAEGCFLTKNDKSYQVMQFATSYDSGAYMASNYAHTLNDGTTRPMKDMMEKMYEVIERYGMEIV